MRGYVTAYDAETGKQVWRFYTVPGDPAKDRTSSIRRRSWRWPPRPGPASGGSRRRRHGVGLHRLRPRARPALHRHRQRLAVEPAASAAPGGGDNLFLVLDRRARSPTPASTSGTTRRRPARTGTTPPRSRSSLADLTIDGDAAQGVMQAPKNGFFYVLDRATGKLISAESSTDAADEWADRRRCPSTGRRLDRNGRPLREPEARYRGGAALVRPARSARTTGTRWRSARRPASSTSRRTPSLFADEANTNAVPRTASEQRRRRLRRQPEAPASAPPARRSRASSSPGIRWRNTRSGVLSIPYFWNAAAL